MQSEDNLKDIIVALIQNNYFEEYVDDAPKNLARDIAEFEKEYHEKLNEK